MPEYFIPIIIVSVFALIVFLAIFYSQKAIIKRKLKKAPTQKIGSFQNGNIAKVVGNIEIVGEPIIAPLSKRPCAFYTLKIEKQVSSGKSTHWKTIVEEENNTLFLIKDESDYALINDTHIKSYIVKDHNYKSGLLKEVPEELLTFLAERGENTKGFLGINKTYRYAEGILEPGEKVAVLGQGNWKDAQELKLPEEYYRVLEIKSTAELAVHLSDDPDTLTQNIQVNNMGIERRGSNRYKK
jgi:hypothetical protein